MIYNILINVLLHKISVQSFTTSSMVWLNVDIQSEILSNALEAAFLLTCRPTEESELTLFPSIVECKLIISLVAASG